MTTWLRRICGFSLLAWCGHLGLPFDSHAGDIVIGNFTGTNYGVWRMTGTAFRLGPASGARLPQLEIENAPDNAAASSEMEGDGPTGTLTSPEFKIGRKYISFFIGGGDYEHDTCLNLLIQGKVVRSATGWRSDRLVPASWERPARRSTPLPAWTTTASFTALIPAIPICCACGNCSP